MSPKLSRKNLFYFKNICEKAIFYNNWWNPKCEFMNLLFFVTFFKKAKLYFIITENPKCEFMKYFLLLQLSLCQRGTLQLCENSGIWHLISW